MNMSEPRCSFMWDTIHPHAGRQIHRCSLTPNHEGTHACGFCGIVYLVKRVCLNKH